MTFFFYAAFLRAVGGQTIPELTGYLAAHSLQTDPTDAGLAE